MIFFTTELRKNSKCVTFSQFQILLTLQRVEEEQPFSPPQHRPTTNTSQYHLPTTTNQQYLSLYEKKRAEIFFRPLGPGRQTSGTACDPPLLSSGVLVCSIRADWNRQEVFYFFLHFMYMQYLYRIEFKCFPLIFCFP